MNFLAQLQKWQAERKAFDEAGTVQKRIQICHNCDHYAHGAGGWCRKCQCSLTLKTLVMETHCPDNPPRW
jgi:hypothetical protein